MMMAKKIWIIYRVSAYTLTRLISFLVLKAIGKLDRKTISFYCQDWAQTLLKIANIQVKVSGSPVLNRPGLLVGNHVSHMDIPVIMSLVYAVFVSKREVAFWPIFGQAAVAVGTIFVDRGSADSRRSVATTLANAVEENSRSICLFPEGTSSLWGKDWKKGSFQIAERFSFPVQAFALKYKPIWECAYIDDDTLMPHLWRLLGHGPIEVEVEFREPILVENGAQDAMKLQLWVQSRVGQFLDAQGLSRDITNRESAKGKDLYTNPLPS